jgi:hypothetical protein
MGDSLRFNNKLSFLKSMTTLIVLFFLGIANDGMKEAHSEESSLLQGLQCPPIIRFPCCVAIDVPLI